MRTRRVGSLTCGCLLIVYGILFIVHMIVPALTYGFIFRLWPLILIALGAEILFANARKDEESKIKYDVGAIVLVFILTIFAMGMGITEYWMSFSPGYYYW